MGKIKQISKKLIKVSKVGRNIKVKPGVEAEITLGKNKKKDK